jgi:hypothetical protein
MSALAVLLVAVGIGDVCRRIVGIRWLPTVVALVVIAACVLLGALWHLGDVPLLVIAAVTSVGWLLLCGRAERMGTNQALPLAVFGAGVALLILLSGWGSDVGGLIGRWSTWAGLFGNHPVDPNRLLMIAGVVLVQLATGNQLVRLVLGSVGAAWPRRTAHDGDRRRRGQEHHPVSRDHRAEGQERHAWPWHR